MSLTVSAKSNYQPLPPGTYAANCVGVIDLGTQTSAFGAAEKIYLDFIVVVDDTKEQRIGVILTASLSPKAKLRQYLETWRGRPFTDLELAGFRLTNLLNKDCLLTVGARTTKDGSTRDAIEGIAKLPVEMTAPPPVADPVAFDLSAPDVNVYNALPDWLRAMIAKAPEFSLAPEHSTTPGTTSDPDDDIPW
jgi:hypothetical protein